MTYIKYLFSIRILNRKIIVLVNMFNILFQNIGKELL